MGIHSFFRWNQLPNMKMWNKKLLEQKGERNKGNLPVNHYQHELELVKCNASDKTKTLAEKKQKQPSGLKGQEAGKAYLHGLLTVCAFVFLFFFVVLLCFLLPPRKAIFNTKTLSFSLLGVSIFTCFVFRFSFFFCYSFPHPPHDIVLHKSFPFLFTPSFGCVFFSHLLCARGKSFPCGWLVISAARNGSRRRQGKCFNRN